MQSPKEIAESLGEATERGYGWMCKCPCHKDDTASLSVHEQDGIIRFKCFAGCLEYTIQAHLGYDKQQSKATVYNYCDESGNVLFHKTRKGKEFRCIAADGSGSVKGIRKVLYMTEKLALAPIHETLIVVEGEKDVDILIRHGFRAVCNFDGAGKWLAEYSEQLRGRNVLVIPDNDRPGFDHAGLVKDKLQGIASSVEILPINYIFEEIGILKLWKGADIHDWFLRGGDTDRFNQIIKSFLRLSDAPDMDLVLRDALALIEHRTSRDGALSGLESGYHALDDILDGFQDSDLIILAARPSVGKTALALNIAENILDSEKNIVFFSMEMGGKQLGARLLHSITKIDNRARELTEGDWRALEAAASQVLDSGLIIDDTSPLNITKLQQRARHYHREAPIDLIIIDYIQYMKGAGEATREREVAAISEGLKTLAKELECPVLALAQLNRTVAARKSNRPFLTDLRDSGAIEQDADVVLLMWNDTNQGIKNLSVEKNRNGPSGDFQLIFDAGQTRFINREAKPAPARTEPEIGYIVESEDFLI